MFRERGDWGADDDATAMVLVLNKYRKRTG
jgi:hypothetical protein